MSLESLVTHYLEYLKIEKNRSPLTITNYNFYLDRFLEWARTQRITKPEQITPRCAHAFQLWLEQIHEPIPLKKNTQNYHLIALRNFLRYLAQHDIASVEMSIIKLAKNPRRSVDFLHADDLEKLLAMPSKSANTDSIRTRDRAILELLFSTGLRISEITSLTREHIHLDKDEFMVRGKGNKYRIVFLSSRAKTHLSAYLNTRKDSLPPLFIRHDRAFSRDKNSKTKTHDAFLTPRSIQRLVHHYAALAGITNAITPQVIRNTFASDLFKSGADVETVQSLLGHASITTTQFYADRATQPTVAAPRKQKKKNGTR